ncbi:unnamed protein product [Acanthocheilonema viteae]|uniref:DUF5641 domain-containing protein n=1 Tax=Acanthocheilonema viteae TaxID=6277 RepID=A0A498SE73_ACAVI|nr:unnamed protein product [Acanthocheilonema viteae]
MLNEIDEKELNIAPFGNKNPNTCLTTRTEVAVKIEKKRTILLETETAREIKNPYVDNIILSTSQKKEALNKYQEIKSIFKDASMNVREFFSNDQIFNSQLPKSDLAQDRYQLAHKSPRNVKRREPVEVVLLDEPHTPRGTWKLARIKKLNVANDGHVRSAQIEPPLRKLLNRPVNTLYPFEVSTEEQ